MIGIQTLGWTSQSRLTGLESHRSSVSWTGAVLAFWASLSSPVKKDHGLYLSAGVINDLNCLLSKC